MLGRAPWSPSALLILSPGYAGARGVMEGPRRRVACLCEVINGTDLLQPVCLCTTAALLQGFRFVRRVACSAHRLCC